MKPPEYDKVLLTGSDEELNEYIENSDKCLVVDWRSDEGGLTDALAEILPAGSTVARVRPFDEDCQRPQRGSR